MTPSPVRSNNSKASLNSEKKLKNLATTENPNPYSFPIKISILPSIWSSVNSCAIFRFAVLPLRFANEALVEIQEQKLNNFAFRLTHQWTCTFLASLIYHSKQYAVLTQLLHKLTKYKRITS